MRVTVQTYVVQVRSRDGQPITMGNPAYSQAGNQPALWGANPEHGPSVFVDVEEGLTFCVNMQREYPQWTYWLIPANEVTVEVPEPEPPVRRVVSNQAPRRPSTYNLAFGRD